jgi:hypothetical protein
VGDKGREAIRKEYNCGEDNKGFSLMDLLIDKVLLFLNLGFSI